MLNWFLENYTLIVVAIGASILGLVSGILGVLNILRKQSLVGDALSHATLPGVVLAFLLTNTRNISVLLIGAAISAFIAMFILNIISKYSKIKIDASLSLILASFFGLGQVLLQIAQGRGSGAAGLKKFIFGQAATMLIDDVYLISFISLFVLILIFVFWKEFKLFIFNEEFYQSLGFSKKITNILLTLMTVIVVVIGIRTVGVILMSALMIAPGVAARQWSNKLSINALLAAIFGLISGALGAIISANKSNLPTGPVIVVSLSVFVIISLFFSPKRGLIQKSLSANHHKKELFKYKSLIDIYNNKPKENDYDYSNYINENYLTFDKNKPMLTDKGIEKVKKLLGDD